MKNYLIIPLVFLLLLACKHEKQNLVSPKAEPTPKSVTINLILIKEIPDDVTDPKNYIQFYVEGDSCGSIIGKPNEFTTEVFAGKMVKWKSAKESFHKIKVKNIILKDTVGNVDILESGNISKDTANVVERKVKKNKNNGDPILKNGDPILKNGDIEFYSLEIEIEDKKYIIDPKLKFHN